MTSVNKRLSTSFSQTVSSALTVMLALAMYPEVQRKAQEQIDSVVGQGRLPTFSDFEDLPYIQAIVKEAGRWHSVVPLGEQHLHQLLPTVS
jgi:cytochrome P450